MELILISESKLKIMLSPPDMARYELEVTRMDCADAHTRAAFRHIFDDVRAEVGFDTAGAPLFVQLYASPEGGCEIFVTKLEGESPPPEASLSLPRPELPSPEDPCSPGERKLLERVFKGEDPHPLLADILRGTASPTAYVFSSLEDLLGVCRRLAGGGWRGKSHVYLEESPDGSLWYLLPKACDPLPSFLAEYGSPIPTEHLETYLREHGRIIRSDDAVEVLGGL